MQRPFGDVQVLVNDGLTVLEPVFDGHHHRHAVGRCRGPLHDISILRQSVPQYYWIDRALGVDKEKGRKEETAEAKPREPPEA